MVQINSNELVKHTVLLIIKNKLKFLDLKQTSCKEYSCWGQITISLFKKFDPIVSLQIWKNWKYNIKKYRKAVDVELEKRGITSFKVSGNNQQNFLFLI
jgi:hypothetical protein